MAQNAPQIQYRQEYIAGFEQHQSLLRMSTTNEAVIKGNQATFLVADSGNAVAVTRGLNGRIPSRSDNLSQPTATLVEWHDLPQRTHFNIFESQGDGRRIMQMTSQAVINRRVDQDVLNELANATYNTGNPTTASMDLVLKAFTILQNNKVPNDGGLTLVASPAMVAMLMKQPEFTNSLYQSKQPINDNAFAWKDRVIEITWLGLKVVTTPQVTGLGTADEQCYMFHKSAVGHAMDVENMQVLSGYDEEQDYYWSRASVFAGAKVLQTAGIVLIRHDGSSMSTSGA